MTITYAMLLGTKPQPKPKAHPPRYTVEIAEPFARQEQVLAYLRGAGRPCTTSEIAVALGVTTHRTGHALQRLARRGLVEVVGQTTEHGARTNIWWVV